MRCLSMKQMSHDLRHDLGCQKCILQASTEIQAGEEEKAKCLSWPTVTKTTMQRTSVNSSLLDCTETILTMVPISMQSETHLVAALC